MVSSKSPEPSEKALGKRKMVDFDEVGLIFSTLGIALHPFFEPFKLFE
jgi:hypothetical protein